MLVLLYADGCRLGVSKDLRCLVQHFPPLLPALDLALHRRRNVPPVLLFVEADQRVVVLVPKCEQLLQVLLLEKPFLVRIAEDFLCTCGEVLSNDTARTRTHTEGHPRHTHGQTAAVSWALDIRTWA